MRRLTSALTAAALALGMSALLTAPAHAAPVKATITLKAGKPMVVKGGKVWLSGKVKAAKPVKGLTLTIQQKRPGGAWKKAGTTTLRKGGAFTWSEKPSSATKRFYRVVLPRSAEVKAARSAAVPVAVAEWRTLKQVKAAQSSWLYRNVTRVNNVKYPDSLITSYYVYSDEPRPTVAYHEVNLFKSCYRVSTDVALTDQTSTGTSATGRILADGAEKGSASTSTLGAKKPLTVNVQGAFRARFEMDLPATGGSNEMRAAFLSPRFLCTTA